MFDKVLIVSLKLSRWLFLEYEELGQKLYKPSRHATSGGDVPWSSPKGSNVRDLQGTLRGLLGDQQKIDNLMKKVFFRCNSSCFTHLLLFFTGKTNMQKF